MILLSILLVAAGIWLLVGPQLTEWLRDVSATAVAAAPQIDRRHMAGAALVAAAALAWSSSGRERAPAPGPTPAPPAPDAPLVLAGLFSPHPEAAADAAKIEALFGEVADELEWDAMLADPMYKSGVAFDELRVRAFDMRCRGISLGDRHPRVREAIRSYLDKAAGISGGPLTPQQKAAWVTAFRTVKQAAGDAIRNPTGGSR